jgi:hypothetical protein
LVTAAAFASQTGPEITPRFSIVSSDWESEIPPAMMPEFVIVALPSPMMPPAIVPDVSTVSPSPRTNPPLKISPVESRD